MFFRSVNLFGKIEKIDSECLLLFIMKMLKDNDRRDKFIKYKLI